MGEGNFNKEDVVSIVKCYRVAKSDRLKKCPFALVIKEAVEE